MIILETYIIKFPKTSEDLVFLHLIKVLKRIVFLYAFRIRLVFHVEHALKCKCLPLTGIHCTTGCRKSGRT